MRSVRILSVDKKHEQLAVPRLMYDDKNTLIIIIKNANICASNSSVVDIFSLNVNMTIILQKYDGSE